MSIQSGDIVQLKTGGPRMTAGFISPGQAKVNCYWFEGSQFRHAEIEREALEPAKPEPDIPDSAGGQL
ncbi:DUF2158 domain-containing protein [Singulisphaera sp. Ch08]|uniref:DUF2158 domain-containing protein n=1 Tax=Singulisphaera sp. Ch08 TaxID=3120278 RepID=A0AAU7CJD3_9BACT